MEHRAEQPGERHEAALPEMECRLAGPPEPHHTTGPPSAAADTLLLLLVFDTHSGLLTEHAAEIGRAEAAWEMPRTHPMREPVLPAA